MSILDSAFPNLKSKLHTLAAFAMGVLLALIGVVAWYAKKPDMRRCVGQCSTSPSCQRYCNERGYCPFAE